MPIPATTNRSTRLVGRFIHQSVIALCLDLPLLSDTCEKQKYYLGEKRCTQTFLKYDNFTGKGEHDLWPSVFVFGLNNCSDE